MVKFFLSLGIIFLGLAGGQIIRYLSVNNILKEVWQVPQKIKLLQKVIILCINPFITMTAFWILRITDLKILTLPLIGCLALALGGCLALAGSKILKHDRKKSGAMFTCGALTNLGSFGGPICFVLLGEISYPFFSMYILLKDFVCYGIVYPTAKLFGDKSLQVGNNDKAVVKLFLDPYILASFTSIIIGLILNMSGVSRPAAFGSVNSVLIPVSSFLLVATVGFTIRFTAVGNYIKESFVIALIKFLIVPASITSIAYLLGLGNLYNGLVLKVILILSSMPPAFDSLIPPQLYGLDVDLANSVWLLNTTSLIMVLPVIYFVQLFLL